MVMIVLYCLLIALVSMGGGYLPLALRITHVKLQVYLSLSAGAMLGAAFFHMLPEAAHLCEETFGLWMAVGVLGLYVIERFLSPHSHDVEEGHRHPDGAGAGTHLECGDGRHGHDGETPAEVSPVPDPEWEHGHGPEPRAAGAHPDGTSAAPIVAGWSAVLGLFLHTLMGGAALGSAAFGEQATGGLGFAVFLATVLHKPADAFTISTLLMKSGYSRRRTFWVQVAFAATIPLGVLLYVGGESALSSLLLESTLTGSVLAFSAGTFVCIAMSDLLPEVQFHSHDRLMLFAAVIAGAAVMGITSLFEAGHGH